MTTTVECAGQDVTVTGHFVIVIILVVYTVEVVSWAGFDVGTGEEVGVGRGQYVV